MIRPILGSMVILCALLAHSSASAVAPGQVDDFQDGTAMGWIHGSIASVLPPANVADAGPGGAGDNALLNVSNGIGGPGSRMALLNESQWTGDYLADSIETISMMVRADPAGDSMDLRLGFEAGIGERAVTDAFALPNDGNWYNFTYDIAPTSLTVVGGALTAEQIMAGVMEMRIFSAPSADWQGEAIAASLYVDNIAAVVPEPSSLGAMALAAIMLTLRRKIG